jgi:ABC-type transport system involved in cytochrome c biogenesis permease subunit
MGLLFGALWAKEAWGHYWTWDPKETWAFLTWAVYLIYIHARIKNSIKTHQATWILALAFAVLLVAWFGVNYLPSAVNSVHTYSQ